MKSVLKKMLSFLILTMVMVFSISRLSAQTPADIPGGSSAPGTVATSGDGPAEVPFDGGMSLILLASGIGYVVINKKDCLMPSL